MYTHFSLSLKKGEVGQFLETTSPTSPSRMIPAVTDTDLTILFVICFVKVVRQPKNYYTWTNSSDGSATEISGDVVNIKYKNDSGLEMKVQDLDQEFDVFIGMCHFF